MPNEPQRAYVDPWRYAAHADWFLDIVDFHRKFGQPIGALPEFPKDGALVELRERLVREEYQELIQALAARNFPEVIDAIIDLIYVLNGMAVTFGCDIRLMWAVVHQANMAKEGGGMRDDGKVMKPPGWVAPDIEGMIERQHENRVAFYQKYDGRTRRRKA